MVVVFVFAAVVSLIGAAVWIGLLIWPRRPTAGNSNNTNGMSRVATQTTRRSAARNSLPL